MHNPGPVSYTHLDVYKRQLLALAFFASPVPKIYRFIRAGNTAFLTPFLCKSNQVFFFKTAVFLRQVLAVQQSPKTAGFSFLIFGRSEQPKIFIAQYAVIYKVEEFLVYAAYRHLRQG